MRHGGGEDLENETKETSNCEREEATGTAVLRAHGGGVGGERRPVSRVRDETEITKEATQG